MPVKSDVCEVWQNNRWRPIYVEDALELPSGTRKRCRVCHGAVRAHKHSNN